MPNAQSLTSAVALKAEVTVDDLIAEAARADPDGAALEFRAEVLTRRELVSRVAHLAALLRAHGVGPDRPVAIYLERSLELVVAQVSVIWAGGAHLAIDTADPVERAAFMLSDLQPQLLITDGTPPADLEGLVPAVLDIRTVVWPANGDERRDPLAGPARQHSERSAAYFIYTSGSTGQPKASLLEHRSLVSRLRWLQDRYRLRRTDRVLYKTACGFDVSVAELYWPLAGGATLVIAEPGGQRDPGYLARMVLDEGISVLHFVPSLLDMFLRERPDHERYPGLRMVLAGGEALPPYLVETFNSRCDGGLHNLYGPSECTIYTTAWECPREPVDTVLIGSAVADTELFVLDDTGRITNDTGELLIAGTGLARGYVRRPVLTAERFVEIRLPGRLPVRAYRTGDLVRHVGGGEYEFLGRLDRQVKIRGYRVELGEIEAVLRSLDYVSHAAVIAADRGRGTVLAACVVLNGAAGADRRAQIKSALGQALPDYMVPAVVEFVDELPLTPNGKLDDRALLEVIGRAQLAGPGDEAAGPDTSLGNPSVDLVATVWVRILGVANVSADDDFFALGGDSLTALDVVFEVGTQCGVEIGVRTLFELPTLREFAAEVARLSAVQPQPGTL